MEEARFLNPPAIARQLGVRVATVLYWIREGELPAMDLSRHRSQRARFKIRVADFEEFLTRRRVLPPTPPVKKRTRKVDASIPEHF